MAGNGKGNHCRGNHTATEFRETIDKTAWAQKRGMQWDKQTQKSSHDNVQQVLAEVSLSRDIPNF